jgi:DNA polymerase elongation subunit (family B)
MREEQISVVGKEQRDIDAMTSIVKLEHEKEYWPYVLFKKKNYAGRKWTPKSVQPLVMKNEIDIKGIQAVRRDTVPWIADLSNDILEILLKIPDGSKPQVYLALDLVTQRLEDLVNNKIELDKFITSKSLAANYASVAIPHVSAWQRMKDRSETDIPSIGSRMPFVFVASKDRKASLSSKAEHPEYVRKTGKKLDIQYYINAAQNPISKLLQFAADDGVLGDIFKAAQRLDENKNTASLDSFLSDSVDAEQRLSLEAPSPVKKKKKTATAKAEIGAKATATPSLESFF